MTWPVRRFETLATWLLGVAFLSAASLKALDFASFVAQLSNYGLVPEGLLRPSAAGLLLAESALAACVLFGWQVRRACLGMLGLLAAFVSATLLRWEALTGTECHCFGRLGGGGPSAVIVQDVVLGTLAVLLLLTGQGLGADRPRRRALRLAAGLAAVGAVVFVAQPTPTESELTRGQAGGEQIRVFLSASCPHCRESLGGVEELARAPGLPPVRVFVGARSDRELAAFFEDAGFTQAYAPLTMRQLAAFVPLVPTVQITRDGHVQAEWKAEVPSVAQVADALSAPRPP